MEKEVFLQLTSIDITKTTMTRFAVWLARWERKRRMKSNTSITNTRFRRNSNSY